MREAGLRESLQAAAFFLRGRVDFRGARETILALLGTVNVRADTLLECLKVANILGSLGFFSIQGYLSEKAWLWLAQQSVPNLRFPQLQALALSRGSLEQDRLISPWRSNRLEKIEIKKIRAYFENIEGTRASTLSRPVPKKGPLDEAVTGQGVIVSGPSDLIEPPDDAGDFLISAVTVGNHLELRTGYPREVDRAFMVGYMNKQTTNQVAREPAALDEFLRTRFKLIRPRRFIRKIHTPQAPLHKAEPRFASQPFLSGFPNMVQIMVQDLLFAGAKNVWLTGIDLFASEKPYRASQLRRFPEGNEKSVGGLGGFLERCRSIAGHNPTENFLFLQRLLLAGRISADRRLQPLLAQGLQSYLRKLDELYGEESR